MTKIRIFNESGLESEEEVTIQQDIADISIIVSKLEFWNMFSTQSQVNVLDAAKTDVMVENFMMQYNMATEIDVKDPLITQGITYLRDNGIITEEEANNVLQMEGI